MTAFAKEVVATNFIKPKVTESISTTVDDYPLGFALAQLHGTYILAENKEGLIIVDAHAAHERINYEKLKELYVSSSVIPAQTILIPISISLNDAEVNCVESNGDLFQKFGFIITRSSQDGILVRSIPVLLQGANVEKLIKDIRPSAK